MDTFADGDPSGQHPQTSAADWRKARTDLAGLAREAPTQPVIRGGGRSFSAHDFVDALGNDVDDILKNGYDDSTGGSSLLTDDDALDRAADKLGCAPAN